MNAHYFIVNTRDGWLPGSMFLKLLVLLPASFQANQRTALFMYETTSMEMSNKAPPVKQSGLNASTGTLVF